MAKTANEGRSPLEKHNVPANGYVALCIVAIAEQVLGQ
jgi:hypothetical protein